MLVRVHRQLARASVARSRLPTPCCSRLRCDGSGLALPPRLAFARALCSGAAGARTLDTPFISDTIPLAEGILGHVQELLAEPGQSVEESEVIAVVETDKVSLEIRASQGGVIKGSLVEVGEQVKEQQAIYELE